ncbi:hypothetical protein C1H46_043038 [Malus baccata]|uniref:Uncharacterized protein n=1 Tax=Malus baccata TaxID=106549 RepID=A0A540KB29_MALBA|nr:hypothetical protein C1H46_043038 [Malus baccata]
MEINESRVGCVQVGEKTDTIWFQMGSPLKDKKKPPTLELSPWQSHCYLLRRFTTIPTRFQQQRLLILMDLRNS